VDFVEMDHRMHYFGYPMFTLGEVQKNLNKNKLATNKSKK